MEAAVASNRWLQLLRERTDEDLLPHQKPVVAYMTRPDRRSLVMAHSTGGGKTRTAGAVIWALVTDKAVARVVVVTTRSVRPQFYDEVFLLLARILHSRRRAQRFMSRYVTIVTHETFRAQAKRTAAAALGRPPTLDDAKGTIAAVHDSYADALVIVDEAHRFCYTPHKEGAFWAVHAARGARKLMLLTATLASNKLNELVTFMALLNDTSVADAAAEFKTAWRDGRALTDDDAATARRCPPLFPGRVSYYDKNADAALRDKYPEVTAEQVNITMTRDFEAAYDAFRAQSYDQVPQILDVKTAMGFSDGEAKKNFIPFHNGVRRLVNAELERGGVGDGKVTYIVSDIRRRIAATPAGEPPPKSIVYSFFDDAGGKQAADALQKADLPFLRISGATRESERQRLREQFNACTDKPLTLIISTAAAEGTDTRGAEVVYILERWWHSGRERQAIGRAARYGSHLYLPVARRRVVVQVLVLRKSTGDSIDQLLQTICQMKERDVTRPVQRHLRQTSIEQQADWWKPGPLPAVRAKPLAPERSRMIRDKGRRVLEVQL
jgi:superfamily II DNA or RNA helicase